MLHEFFKQRPNKPNAGEVARQISNVYSEISPSYEDCKKQRLKPGEPGNVHARPDPPPEEVHALCVLGHQGSDQLGAARWKGEAER